MTSQSVDLGWEGIAEEAQIHPGQQLWRWLDIGPGKKGVRQHIWEHKGVGRAWFPKAHLNHSHNLQGTETCARHIAKLWACRVKETGSCWKGAYSLIEWICTAGKVVGNKARSWTTTCPFYWVLTIVPDALLSLLCLTLCYVQSAKYLLWPTTALWTGYYYHWQFFTDGEVSVGRPSYLPKAHR